MNLTWHIVRKDIRRMGAPVAGWVAFTAGSAWWFGSLRMPEEVALAGDASRWMTGVSGLAGVLTALPFVAGGLLAGGLALEDVVGGANAGWRTRPISGARLLGAKLLAAGLLLVLAPVVALMPVWIANGFSAGECAAVVGDAVVWHGATMLVALAIAALVENIAQFTFAALAIATVFAICASKLLVVWVGVEGGPKSGPTAKLVTIALPFVAAGVVLVQQYLTRRTRRGWLVIGLVMAASFGIRAAWTWEFLPLKNKGDDVQPTGVRELPLRAGAEARSGADYLRVANVSETRGRPFRVILEEHGSTEILKPWRTNGPAPQIDFGPWEYRLVDARGGETPLTITQISSTGLPWLALRVWQLDLNGPPPADWADGAVLRRTPRTEEASASTAKNKGRP